MKGFNFEVVHFGIFDSHPWKTGAYSKERTVGFFEFELFSDDCDRFSFIDGKAIPRKRGTLICAKPGQKRYSQLPFRCHYLHIASEDENFIATFEALPDTLFVHDYNRVVEMFEGLLKYDGDSTENILNLKGGVYKLLAYILGLSNTSPAETNPALHTYRKSLLDSANYIKHHLNEKLTLEKLSQVANLSPIYFHKLFCERFGKTPNQYILEHRIEAAKLALLSENASILNIAESYGFSTQSYFNNKFKESTGMTPLQYRKSMLRRLKL